jgi:hypothetical protein
VLVAATEPGCWTHGKWANVKDRYLGLKFQIDGKTHYGWPRLSVQLQQQNFQITATLTGYAYETVPHKRIRAGQSAGADEVTTSSGSARLRGHPTAAKPVSHDSQPASLGQLALGAAVISPWRRP